MFKNKYAFIFIMFCLLFLTVASVSAVDDNCTDELNIDNKEISTTISSNNETYTNDTNLKDSDLIIGIYEDNRLTLGDDGVIYGQIQVAQRIDDGNVITLSTTNLPNLIVSIDGMPEGSAYLVNKNIIKFKNLSGDKEYTLRVLVNDTDYKSKEYIESIYVYGSSDPVPATLINNTNETPDDDNNNHTSTPITIAGTPKQTKITAKNKVTFKAKTKTKKYTITLKAGKNAVKKVKVYLKIGKKTYTAKTNNKGQATFKINLNKKGTYNSKITFKGGNSYFPTSKNVKIICK